MSVDRCSDDIGEDVFHVRAGSCLFNGGFLTLFRRSSIRHWAITAFTMLGSCGTIRESQPRISPSQAEDGSVAQAAHPQGQTHGHSHSLEYCLSIWYVSLFSSSPRGFPPVVTSSPSARSGFLTCTLIVDPSYDEGLQAAAPLGGEVASCRETGDGSAGDAWKAVAVEFPGGSTVGGVSADFPRIAKFGRGLMRDFID